MSLKLENINFAFTTNKPILDNFSMELEQGKIYALMGANGAGKSTLFNIITGFIKAQSGIIYFNEKNITKLKPYKRNLLGIGRTFQDLRIITNLTVVENISLAFKNNLSDKWYNTIFPNRNLKTQQKLFHEKAHQILKTFNLFDVQSHLASDISYGQQKLLTVACCVANDADIILLDEPVAGVNPVFRDQLIKILTELKAKNKTILLIEHNTDFINEIADEIYFIANGKVSPYKTIAEMKQDINVLNAYM